MRNLIVAVILVLLSSIASADRPSTQPVWYPGYVGDVFRAFCERGLGGEYVMSEPNFYQAWACEDGDWCQVRPDTFGCRRPTPN